MSEPPFTGIVWPVMKPASALSKKAYYFVPLTVSEGEETLIAERYDVGLSDNAVCHPGMCPSHSFGLSC